MCMFAPVQAVQSLMNTAVAPDVKPQDTAALEVSAAAAGALALPVLAWSLFTLKTTGARALACRAF